VKPKVGRVAADRRAMRLWSRRRAIAAGAASLCAGAAPAPVRAAPPVTFGVTPVFLESDVKLLAAIEAYLGRAVGRAVHCIRRRSYQEISALLLSGQLDAAWICGFPYVQFRDRLELVAVPLYHNRPYYQSYLIVHRTHRAQRPTDLRGDVHAFSDPDSNSGWLVTRHWLATMNETPTSFFARHFFTYGHRNVIRAVSAGLAQSGSVDGYVWDVVKELEPSLVHRTRVVRRSEWLGFPPVCCNRGVAGAPLTLAIRKALASMHEDAEGRGILSLLKLDGFAATDVSVFDGIAEKWRVVQLAG
jgi:phosphonate transport system substrate-binding protein